MPTLRGNRARLSFSDRDYVFLQGALQRMHVLGSFKLKYPQKSAAAILSSYLALDTLNL